MAVSLSNNVSLCTPRLSSSASTPSKTPNVQTLTLQPNLHRCPRAVVEPIFGFSFFNSMSIVSNDNNNRRSFKSSLAVNCTSYTNDEVGAESKADQNYSSSLKSLMKVYKAAIVNRDGRTISKIEALMCMVENEKNEFSEKVSSLKAEINSGKEKYLRLQADFDNYRKRSEKERLTVSSDAQEEVIESLLPMVDSFERAKEQIKLETEKEKNIDRSYQGIYKQFVEIMRSWRVAVVPTVGKRFDPVMHEAVARKASQEFQEGIVVEELRRGFLLGDQLLRPAMVKVSAGPGRKKPTGKSSEPATTVGVDER